MIYKSSQLDKPVCKDLYEMIQLTKKRNLWFINWNQVIVVLLKWWKKSDMDKTLIKSYHPAIDYDS